MPDTIIVVSPALDETGKRHHDRFDAYLQSDLTLVARKSRQPLLDSSRELLRLGYDPTVTVGMVWSHSPTKVTLKAPIGVAAQYDTMGERFVRRKEPVQASPMSKPDGPKTQHRTRSSIPAK